MQRRSFITTMGGLAAAGARNAGAAEEKKTRYYVLENYYLKNGTQPSRINEFMSKTLPIIREFNPAPSIYLEAQIAPHTPQFAVIRGFRSLEEWVNLEAALAKNKAYQQAYEAWEAHAEPPYENASFWLLEATSYSPELVIPATPPASPRLFEFRVYRSPTVRQQRALHERFDGPEIKIFHRTGVHPVLYTNARFGPTMPGLVYLIPFDNLAAREKAWAAFGADPEWVKVRQESIDKSGQITAVNTIAVYRATAYSPIR